MTQERTWLEGGWMLTYTGQQFWPTKPDPSQIYDEDIAHALSLTCRYGGHVSRFYSVAEHCLLMAMTMPNVELALAALLHDAAEAYVGDMVRPLKLSLPAYSEIEDGILRAIGDRYDVELVDLPAEVKEADNRILLDERWELLNLNGHRWDDAIESQTPLGVKINGWDSRTAEQVYLHQMRSLV